MGQVSPLTCWVGNTLTTPEMIVGAIELAHQQYLDGMGGSPEQWTGLSTEQLARCRDQSDRLELAAELLEAAMRRRAR